MCVCMHMHMPMHRMYMDAHAHAYAYMQANQAVGKLPELQAYAVGEPIKSRWWTDPGEQVHLPY